MRVTIVGGGGFRTPLVVGASGPLGGGGRVDEVVLQDPAPDRLARVEAVLRGLRDERGGGPDVTTTTSLEEAVDGADFVFCAIRVGGLAGRIVDETVPLALGVLGQETVGPGGIAFALRTVPVMDEIAAVVARRAPRTWFCNFTNPAGLVTEALRDVLGDRVVGICDSPTALCARVAAVLGRPSRDLAFGYGGLNHLGWLLRVTDRETGVDLLPGLLADEARVSGLDEARLFGLESLRRRGAIPNEYVAYREMAGEIAAALRRDGSRGQVLAAQQAAFYEGPVRAPLEALAAWRATKDLRHGTYMAEARVATDAAVTEPAPVDDEPAGAAAHVDDEGPGEAGYAAVAWTFVSAVTGDAPETLILDAPNTSRMPFLEPDAVIEAPCAVHRDAVRPLAVGRLAADSEDLVARVKEVERITIRAARAGSASLALEAIAADPLVPTRAVAERILEGYLDGHPVLRERLR